GVRGYHSSTGAVENGDLSARRFDARELTPVPRHSEPTMRPSSPIAANPNGMGIRRITPVTTHPKPSAVPNPFAVYPDIVRSGRDNDRFHRHGWWRFCHDHRACLRRVRPGSCADGTRRVNHEINDPVAHTGAAQINDVRRAEMIDRVRIANLADDDVVVDPRPGQRLDIRHAQRLSL